MSIIQDIYNQIDSGVIATISNSSSNIIAMFSPLAGAGFSLYVMLILVDYARGADVAESFIDFAKRMLKWTAIGYCGLNVGIYNGTITSIIQGAGAEIGSAFSGSGSTSVITTLDSMFDSYTNTVKAMWDETSRIDIVGGLYSLISIAVLIVSAIFFLVYAAFYVTLAKFALGVSIALGPLFIMTLFFPATASFFGSWLSTVLNYIILEVLVNILVRIQINIISSTAFDGDITKLLSVACAGFFCSMMLMNLPVLAAKLSGGGIALGGGGIALGTTRSGAKMAGLGAGLSMSGLSSLISRSGGSMKGK
jgi:type IV secretion system protein VirB6